MVSKPAQSIPWNLSEKKKNSGAVLGKILELQIPIIVPKSIIIGHPLLNLNGFEIWLQFRWFSSQLKLFCGY